jgi:hypothetical protein
VYEHTPYLNLKRGRNTCKNTLCRKSEVERKKGGKKHEKIRYVERRGALKKKECGFMWVLEKKNIDKNKKS